MIYIISYSLHRPGQEYTRLYEAIKGISGTYWHHTTSAWLVDTTLSAKQIFEHLSPHILDTNDDLVVFRLQGEWWGLIHDVDSMNWVKQRSF